MYTVTVVHTWKDTTTAVGIQGDLAQVDSAPFEIKYFWTEIHKCLSFENVFDRF